MPWSKMRWDLHEDPHVLRIWCELGQPDIDLVIGKCFRLWRETARVTADGLIRAANADVVDAMVAFKGFGKAMEAAGWLEFTPAGAQIVRFGEHNSYRAKRNAAAQASRGRGGTVVFPPTEDDASKPKPTPAEKEADKQTLTTGFEAFWAAYPNHKSKIAAAKAWRRLHPDAALTAEIMKAIQVQRTWDQWTKEGGKFIPHPATWLNGQRWQDTPTTAPQAGMTDEERRAKIAAERKAAREEKERANATTIKVTEAVQTQPPPQQEPEPEEEANEESSDSNAEVPAGFWEFISESDNDQR